MLHAELIGLEGEAPDALAWTRPQLLQTATERHEALIGIDELPLDEAQAEWGLPNVWQGSAGGSGTVARGGPPF